MNRDICSASVLIHMQALKSQQQWLYGKAISLVNDAEAGWQKSQPRYTQRIKSGAFD
jgi:hypothetical protein